MRAILTKDVHNIGQTGDIKTVSSGYGRNFLLARGLAKIATDVLIAQKQKQDQGKKDEQKINKKLLLKNISGLKGVKITMHGKANEKGHLFAGIHKEEIALEIKKQAHMNIDKERIDLQEPIKELGEYKLTAKIGKVKAEFTLVVEGVKK